MKRSTILAIIAVVALTTGSTFAASEPRLLITCNPGQYKSGTKCYNCPVACRACTSSSTCTSCSSGYTLNYPRCTSCGNYCTGCTGNNVCTECSSGYRLVSGSCRTSTSTKKRLSGGATAGIVGGIFGFFFLVFVCWICLTKNKKKNNTTPRVVTRTIHVPAKPEPAQPTLVPIPVPQQQPQPTVVPVPVPVNFAPAPFNDPSQQSRPYVPPGYQPAPGYQSNANYANNGSFPNNPPNGNYEPPESFSIPLLPATKPTAKSQQENHKEELSEDGPNLEAAMDI